MKNSVLLKLISVFAILTLLFGGVSPGGVRGVAADWAQHRLEVHPQSDLVYARGWSKGDELTMTITDPDGRAFQLGPITVGDYPWDSNSPAGDFSSLADFQPGQTLDVMGAGVGLTYIIPDPKVTEIDIINDTIRGTGTPGARMLVSPGTDFYRWTTTDGDGTWIVDLKSPEDPGDTAGAFNLVLGSSGWADEFDEYGNQTWANDWSVPNPTFEVRPNTDQVRGWGWKEGETLTLHVQDRERLEEHEFVAEVGVTSYDPNQTYVEFNIGDTHNIQPGDYVSLSNGMITKDTVVTDLELTGLNAINDTVSGKATAGTNIDLWASPGYGDNTNRHVTAGEDGTWQADFAHPGTGVDEQGIFDIVPGTWVDSQQVDEDGDSTMFGKNVPNPVVNAHLSENRVDTTGWPAGSTVSLTIDINAYQAEQQTSNNPWDSQPGYANFYFGPNFTLEPEQVIMMTDGTLTKSLKVMDLYPESLDPQAKTVKGRSQADAKVAVSMWVDQGGWQEVTADGSGAWQASYGAAASPFYPYTRGDVTSYDEDGDATITWINGFNIAAWPQNDTVELNSCTPYHRYTVEASGPAHSAVFGPENVQCLPTEWDPANGYLAYRLTDFDLVAGDTVTVNSSHEKRILEVAPQGKVSFDTINDVVSGTNQASSYVVSVTGDDQGNYYNRHTQADGTGVWTFDYSQVSPENMPPEDIVPGKWANIGEFDADGDLTFFNWNAPNPRFNVRANVDQVEAFEWPLGASLTLTIGGETFPSQQVGQADWDPNQTYAVFNVGDQYDIQPGDLVSLTNGAITKETQVTELTITNFGWDDDLVLGKAAPGSAVDLWACGPDACYNRHVTAGMTGDWTADFAHPGTLPDEQNTVDIVGGVWVDSQQVDDDGDLTMYGVQAPNPIVNAYLNENRIETYGWPLKSTLHIWIYDSAGTHPLRQITVPAPWDSTIGYASIDLGPKLILQPGQVIEISNGFMTKTLTVMDLYSTSFNHATRTASGHADPGAEVQVEFWSQTGETISVQAGEDGSWVVHSDLSSEPFSYNDGGIVRSTDSDGDSTAFNLKNWMIYATPEYDWFELGCTNYQSYNLEIDDPSNGVGVDYTKTYSFHPDDPTTACSISVPLEGFDLDAGDLIKVTSRHFVRMLVVPPRNETNFHLISDSISGKGVPDAWVGNWREPGIWRDSKTDQAGNWFTDFSTATGLDTWNSAVDILPGQQWAIFQIDEDGDFTDYETLVPMPTKGGAAGLGWFNSPAGALISNPAFTGKAAFTFAAAYDKRSATFKGTALLTIKGFIFKSTTLDWLAVEGSRMQLTGNGQINGKGNYGFMINAAKNPQARETIGIRIWKIDTGEVVYDSMLGAADNVPPVVVIKDGGLVFTQ